MKDTVKQLSRRLGVSPDTVRHYRETGVIHPEAAANGYRHYSEHDMLRILVTREMRSMDISLGDADDFFKNRTIGEFNGFLDAREQQLAEQLEHLTLALERVRETRVYARCAETLPGKVEEFDGAATVAVSSIGTEDPYSRGETMRAWLDHLPFTYISATVSLEDLENGAPQKPFAVTCGAGALEKYVRAFSLPVPEYAHHQPGGHFIRTCITTRDILNIGYDDLKILYDYRDAHGLRFAGCTGGRVLFMEDLKDGPVYHLLVWVPVRQCGEKA